MCQAQSAENQGHVGVGVGVGGGARGVCKKSKLLRKF